MKTALRQAIDKFEGIKAKSISFKDSVYLDGILAVLDGFIETEKTQIKNAYEDGVSDGDKEEYPNYKNSEEYFTQTYLPNESNQ